MGRGAGGRLPIRRELLDDRHVDLGHALVDYSQALGCITREVEDAAVDIGSAVIDPNHDRLAGFHIGDLKPGAERQGSVRGRQLARIEVLAVRGFDARAVEARDSGPFALDSDDVDGRGGAASPSGSDQTSAVGLATGL